MNAQMERRKKGQAPPKSVDLDSERTLLAIDASMQRL